MKTKTQIFMVMLTAIIIYSCGTRWNNSSLVKDTICSNYNNQISKLPKNLINEMTTGYVDDQKLNIDNGLLLDDARTIWFDLETVKQFVYHIENSAKNDKNNPTNIKDLGIRIYYANYPDKQSWNSKYKNELGNFATDPLRKDYAGLHTLIFIPTRRDADGVDLDFDPSDNTTYINGIENTSSSQMTAAIGPMPSNNSSTSNNNVGAQNHGGLFPPHTYLSKNGVKF